KADVKRCVGGFSSMPIGSTCQECGNCLIRTAYEREELIAGFERFAEKFPLAWYLERNDAGVTLASVVWFASAEDIASEKYQYIPGMRKWMEDLLGKTPVMWLDEIFADRSKKPSGNLSNFRNMCMGFADEFGSQTMAFRTINPRLVAAAKRDFEGTSVYPRNDLVPDRRDFVLINLEQ
ncbi:MAG: hypothetical protein HY426_03165, partial [Candidatus Levybacteria bacterium]|nr:hypothetical protein [Candidatus Levybacteria bacterium]